MKKKKVKKLVKKPVKKVKKKTAVKKPLAKTKKKKATSIPAGASLEEVGIITHYFPKVDAAVVKLTKAGLSIGDKIVIKGHTSDFKEKVDSIQLDHEPIQNAEKDMEIGLKVKSKVRDHDVVYKIVS